MSRHEVEKVLSLFKAQLELRLAEPGCLEQLEGQAREEKARSGSANVSWENMAVGSLIVPALHAAVREHAGEAKAQEIVFSENVVARTTVGTSPKTFSREVKHPFTKLLNDADPITVFGDWAAGALGTACPDAALGPPYKVVFEAKYSRATSETAAKKELVAGLYQAFFYRGLPPAIARDTKRKADWDYDFACFVAIDKHGALRKAWESIKPLEQVFWKSAHIFPVIVGPPEFLSLSLRKKSKSKGAP